MVKKSPEVQLAEMAKDISYIRGEVTEIKQKLEDDYVTKAEFDPIKKIVYGVVGIILTGVIVALLGLVVIK